MRHLILALVAAASAQAAEFKAGAFAADISPTSFPAAVNGSMKGGFAEKITDPMHARCVALHDGRMELILCVVDGCMIPREICEEAKRIASEQTGVPAAHMTISATHSHSCATMTAVFQSDPDPAYVAALPPRIAQGLIRAHQNLEPAQIAWGKDSDPTQVFCRRWNVKDGETNADPFGGNSDRVIMNPGLGNKKVTGPSAKPDPEVGILALRSRADQRPLAVFANYSLHYVGGQIAISADYFAAFANELTTRLQATGERYAGKPAFVGVMSNGTSGDINNIDFSQPKAATIRTRSPGSQIQVVAASVADAAMRAFETLSWQDHAPLASAERDLTLGVRKPTAADLAAAEKTLADTPKDKDGQWSKREAIYARETTLIAKYPDTVPVKLQALRIGSLTIATIPCETFVDIGHALRAAKPLDQHFTISLANGYNGYLPTPEHHALGGYETWRARSSYLEVNASVTITTALKEMMQTVSQ